MNRIICKALLVATVFTSATVFLSSQAPAQLLPWRRATVCCPPVRVVDPCCGYTNDHWHYHVGAHNAYRPLVFGFGRAAPMVYGPIYYTSTMPATVCCGVTYSAASESSGTVTQPPKPEDHHQPHFESGTLTVEPPPDADRHSSHPRDRDQ